MHLLGLIHATAVVNLCHDSIDRLKKNLFFVIKDVILAWPRAFFIATPQIFSDVKIILSAKASFNPHIQQICQLAWKLIAKSSLSITTIQKGTESITNLADQMQGVDGQKFFQTLQAHRKQWEELGSFIKSCLLINQDDVGDQFEFIPELAKVAALLNALVEDLSSRKGFLSINKDVKEGASLIAAKAEAIIVEDLNQEQTASSPIDPYEDTQSDGEQDVSVITLEPKQRLIFEKKSPLNSPRVVVNLHPINVVMHSFDEEQFLTNIKQLTLQKDKGFADQIVAFVYFIAVDVLCGVPKFLIYDLPQMIINIQINTAWLVSHIYPTAQFIIELKDNLKAWHGLLESLEKLSPITDGLELYCAKHLKQDFSALKEHYELMIASISNALVTIDVGQVHEIKKQMKTLLIKSNPLLIKILETLKGRSLMSVMMRSSSGFKSTVKTGEGSTSSSSSVDSNDSSESRDKVQEALGKVGVFFKTLVTPKPTV